MKEKKEKIGEAICDMFDKEGLSVEDAIGLLIDMLVAINSQSTNIHLTAIMICTDFMDKVKTLEEENKKRAEMN